MSTPLCLEVCFFLISSIFINFCFQVYFYQELFSSFFYKNVFLSKWIICFLWFLIKYTRTSNLIEYNKYWLDNAIRIVGIFPKNREKNFQITLSAWMIENWILSVEICYWNLSKMQLFKQIKCNKSSYNFCKNLFYA